MTLVALLHDLNQYLLEFVYIKLISLTSSLLLVFLPVCGCRVSSCHPGRTVADVIIVRCWVLQSEGMFLPREGLHTNSIFWRNHAPPLALSFFSLEATRQLYRGSPGTGGKLPLHTNYLNARHLTYISPWWVTVANCGRVPRSILGSEAVAQCCPSSCMWSTACFTGNQAQPFYLLKAKVLSLQTVHFPFTLRSVS